MVHRLIILGFLVIFVAAIIFAVISFSSSGKSPESERKLGQYSTQDIGSVLDFLENEGYKYRLSGNTISVDVKDYNEITEKMLRKGIALPQEKLMRATKLSCQIPALVSLREWK